MGPMLAPWILLFGILMWPVSRLHHSSGYSLRARVHANTSAGQLWLPPRIDAEKVEKKKWQYITYFNECSDLFFCAGTISSQWIHMICEPIFQTGRVIVEGMGTLSRFSHDDVIKWKAFPRYWPFVLGIHRSPVNYPHKGQWRGALMLSCICALNKRLNQSWGWWLRRHRAHYDVIATILKWLSFWRNLASLQNLKSFQNVLSESNVFWKYISNTYGFI